jgi:hypothetical protein
MRRAVSLIPLPCPDNHEADITCLRAAARSCGTKLKPGGDTFTPPPGPLRDRDRQRGAEAATASANVNRKGKWVMRKVRPLLASKEASLGRPFLVGTRSPAYRSEAMPRKTIIGKRRWRTAGRAEAFHQVPRLRPAGSICATSAMSWRTSELAKERRHRRCTEGDL